MTIYVLLFGTKFHPFFKELWGENMNFDSLLNVIAINKRYEEIISS